MDKLNVGLLYLSLYNQLVKRVGANREITRKDFFCIIGKHFLVPKNLKNAVVKEMEDRKLIEAQGNKILILENDFDIENTNKIYSSMGLF